MIWNAGVSEAVTRAESVLKFWFGDLEDGLADAVHRASWFSPDQAFDEACRNQFEPLLDAARGGLLTAWLTAPRSCLAFIIVCDQLPRNIHRGSSNAFALDSLALQAARLGVRQRLDRRLEWDERAFFYMPFEHSEAILDQHTAVGLYTALRDQSPKSMREVTGNNLRFAQQHRDIIERFGRFPHRNAVLGRQSSTAEQAFVDAGDGFGQQPR